MKQYRKPDNSLTSDRDEYLDSWRELIEPLEKRLNSTVISFDPCICFKDKDSAYTFTISPDIGYRILGPKVIGKTNNKKTNPRELNPIIRKVAEIYKFDIWHQPFDDMWCIQRIGLGHEFWWDDKSCSFEDFFQEVANYFGDKHDGIY